MYSCSPILRRIAQEGSYFRYFRDPGKGGNARFRVQFLDRASVCLQNRGGGRGSLVLVARRYHTRALSGVEDEGLLRHIYMSTYTCRHMYICVYTYSVYECMHMPLCTYLQTHVRTYVCTYILTYFIQHTYRHACMHTYIHTYIFIRVCM